jgi:Cu/Ag efflux pump CusA
MGSRLCYSPRLLLLGSLGAWRNALLVYSAVPLALTGGVAVLWLRDMTFSICKRANHPTSTGCQALLAA